MIIVGDVDRCIDKMKKYADLGVDQLLCYVQFGKLPHDAVMRNIELLGTEVIPMLERYEPRPRSPPWLIASTAAHTPPSTRTSQPVMKLASSETRTRRRPRSPWIRPRAAAV